MRVSCVIFRVAQARLRLYSLIVAGHFAAVSTTPGR